MDGGLLKTDFKSERLINKTRTGLDALLTSKLDLVRMRIERTDQTGGSTALPINEQVYDFLVEQKKAGKKLILLCRDSVDSVTEMLGERNIFDQIIHRDDTDNIKSQSAGTYDYIGTKGTALTMWEGATNRHVVEKSDETTSALTQNDLAIANRFHRPGIDFKAVLKSIRAYQWLKNLLVFVPLITSQQFTNTGALFSSFIMFFCFSMVASFGYIVNDILDLQSDRAHPTKRERPFANGKISIPQGVIIGAILLTLAVIGCSQLPVGARLALAGYFVLTISYSLYLKTKVMIDVVALAGLFTLRVIGGGAAIETELSFYLLCFSIFLFSSLGLVKRFAELHNLQLRNKLTARGRGYRVEDMIPIIIIGITLGNLSVFVMGLYINSPVVAQFYSNTKFIWFLLPLLTYWLGRLWILANRGEMNEDPLIFAIKDRTSVFVLIIAGAILFIAQ